MNGKIKPADTSANYLNILVVDDQEDVRRGLKKLISKAGCEFEIASSGEEAMDLLKNCH